MKKKEMVMAIAGVIIFLSCACTRLSREEAKPIPADDKPAAVKAVEAKAPRVYKSEKGFWEADYGEGLIMVYIPAGEFPMGTNDGNDYDKPVHNVFLDGYWLGKTEVTMKQFRAFVRETGYLTDAETGNGAHKWTGKRWKENKKINWKNPGYAQTDDHPVSCISWNDAVRFCQWLSVKKNLVFSLPTEAQWEKGARGSDGRKYPWGNHELYYNGIYYANYYPENRYGGTSPVGLYPQGESPFGLLDMAGNVWEWCSDWYQDDYYNSSPSKNPTGPARGESHVMRGGCWFENADYARSAYHTSGFGPPESFNCYGFRLAQAE